MPHLEHEAKLLSSKAKLSRGRLAIYSGLTALVGIVVVVVIFAATGSLAIEAESGTLGGAAKVVTATDASGGKAVQFGSGATPTPTPTATPSSTPTSGWPNAGNTGVPAGQTLTASGSITVTVAGTVISNKDISGSVDIKAANVTIKNCKIHNTDTYGVQVDSGNVTIMDSELWDNNGFAIGHDNYSAIRVNIHDEHQDGMKWGNNTSLTDSYVHNFTPASGAHADGGQAEAGASNLVIRHNFIDPSNGGDLGNSAVFLKNDLGSNSSGPITVDNNLLGGGNYSLYAVSGNGGNQTGITITNNHFLRDFQYGAVDVQISVTASGNVWNDTGAAVSF